MCGGAKGESKDKPRLIFVVGGPGSGKGTQCAKIVEKEKFEHLSTGDLLRAEVKKGSDKGKELQKTMSEGGLVTTADLLVLLEAAMREKGWAKCPPILIDGFPRNEENVTVFGDMLMNKINLIGVLNFEVSAEEMEKRCLGRGEGRADDNVDTIKKRLNTFQTETVPTIAKLKTRGNVWTIDASKSKDEVTVATQAAVDQMLGRKKEEKKAAPVEAPKEQAPVQEAPKEEAPVQEAPKEEAPVEEAPKEEAPVEEPKQEEAPVEEPKPEEAPKEEAKPEEAPAE